MRAHTCVGIAACLLSLFRTSPGWSQSAPGVRALYTESVPMPGTWRYSYVFYNDADPANVGTDLFAIALFPPSTFVSVLNVPSDWDALTLSGNVTFYSLAAGTPPVGADIGPSSFLGGFVLETDTALGDILFTALVSNPTDPSAPFVVDGVTAPIPNPALVPEPAPIVSVITGLAVMVWVMRRRTARARLASLYWLRLPEAHQEGGIQIPE
jgi:hypothetical protein